MPSAIPLSLYIHLPWCLQKCPYCDFNSHQLKSPLPESKYINALIADLQQDVARFSLAGRTLSSIFIGGGTPSLFSADAIASLLAQIKQLLTFSPAIEITMEANPGSLEAEKFGAYAKAGVNRLSIGVQSFDDEKLRTLGRIHNSENAIAAARLVTTLGFNSVNLDLMHGLPSQTTDEALADLRQAIALNPTHLSWYQLTIEPNTQYFSRPPTLPDDDTLWDIYQQGHQLLQQAGFVQYETSGYSKAGFECQHNLNYWRFGDYLGIGCGAHGKLTLPNMQIVRTVKTKHPRGYLDPQQPYLADLHHVEPQDLGFEYVMNRFRLLEPCPKAEFSARTGLPLTAIATPIAEAIAQGLLSETQTHWQVTAKGRLFLNDLLTLFIHDSENDE